VTGRVDRDALGKADRPAANQITNVSHPAAAPLRFVEQGSTLGPRSDRRAVVQAHNAVEAEKQPRSSKIAKGDRHECDET